MQTTNIPGHSEIPETGEVVATIDRTGDLLSLLDAADITGHPISRSPQVEPHRIETAAAYQTRAASEGRLDRLEAAIVAVSENGGLEVVSGRHRILAAARTRVPIPVRFSQGL